MEESVVGSVRDIITPHIDVFVQLVKEGQEKLLMFAMQVESFQVNSSTANLAAIVNREQRFLLTHFQNDLKFHIKTLEEQLCEAVRASKKPEKTRDNLKKPEEENDPKDHDAGLSHSLATITNIQSQLTTIVPLLNEAKETAIAQENLIAKLKAVDGNDDLAFRLLQSVHSEELVKLNRENIKVEEMSWRYKRRSRAFEEEVNRLRRVISEKERKAQIDMQTAVQIEATAQLTRHEDDIRYLENAHNERIQGLVKHYEDEILQLKADHGVAIDRLRRTIREGGGPLKAAVPHVQQIIPQLQEIIACIQEHVNTNATVPEEHIADDSWDLE